MTTRQEILVNQKLLDKVRSLILTKQEVFSFREHRYLASLACCLGIRAEMGTSLDRLSDRVGINLRSSRWIGNNPWNSKIISFEGEIGIQLWIDGYANFTQIDSRLAQMLHPLSLSDSGQITSLTLFPGSIADLAEQDGLNLVIVRDWILNCALAPPTEIAVNYFYSNTWEMKTNIGAAQANLIVNEQLPFFGTHDLVDHLLGFNLDCWKGTKKIAKKSQFIFAKIKEQLDNQSIYHLTFSYLLAIILDDLVQPCWYESEAHLELAELLFPLLENPDGIVMEKMEIPVEFSEFTKLLRSNNIEAKTELHQLLGRFLNRVRSPNSVACSA